MQLSDTETVGRAIAHVPALDGVRGLAIALVLAVHFGVGAGFPQHWPGPVSEWLERLCYVGWIGVDVFFVLSGFLITSILLASRHRPDYFWRFYSRRALRIFPLYFSALALGLVILPRLWPDFAPILLADALHEHVWLWTYTLNIANAFGWQVNAGVLAQMWSLAIEEQFYLVWPWLVRSASLRRLGLACGVLVVMALAGRVVWISVDGLTAWPGPYRFTLTRIDALATGAGIALVQLKPLAFRRCARFADAGLGVTGGALLLWFLSVPRFYPDQPGVVTVGHSLLAAWSGCIVIQALRPVPPRWMSLPVLTMLGKYSYGLYVWHWPVQYSLTVYGKGTLSPLTYACGGVLASMALAFFSFRVLEQPILRLKNRIPYANGGTTTLA